MQAFQALVGGHKLSNSAELELVASLDIPPHQAWLKLLYTGRCKKYEQRDGMEATLAALENEPPNRQAAAAAAAGGSAARQQQQQQQQQLGGVQTPGRAAGGGGGEGGVGGVQAMALSPVQEEPPSGSSAASTPMMMMAEVGTAPPRAAAAASAAAPGGSGWGLHDNLDVIACRAEWLYHRGAYGECYQLTATALERDPYAAECLPVHLASALELRKKGELFVRGHK